MFRVRVTGLPYLATEQHIQKFFDTLSVSRILMLKDAGGEPLGQAAVYFEKPDDAVTATEDYHGRFMFTGSLAERSAASEQVTKPVSVKNIEPFIPIWRRVSVYSEEIGASMVREEYLPEEPTKEKLKDKVHKKAIGGDWPSNIKYGIISFKNRIRRYKPPGNPKPRHG